MDFYQLHKYEIMFLVYQIVIAALIIFLLWRYKVGQRNRLARQCRGWAIIHPRTKSWQGFDSTSSLRIRKIDGRKAETFLYKWPRKHAVYVKPGIHDIEARAEWDIQTWPHGSWFQYKVDTLPAVSVEADTEYALEYEVKDDMWTLFRLGKNQEKGAQEVVEERFAHLGGKICDYHLRLLNILSLLIFIAVVLFMKFG